MSKLPVALSTPRPAAPVLRALAQAARWALLLAIGSLTSYGLGLLGLFLSVEPLQSLPQEAARPLRWLLLLAIVLNLAPLGSAALLLRYALSGRRLSERSSYPETEAVLSRLSQYWHWSAVMLLVSVSLGIVGGVLAITTLALAR